MNADDLVRAYREAGFRVDRGGSGHWLVHNDAGLLVATIAGTVSSRGEREDTVRMEKLSVAGPGPNSDRFARTQQRADQVPEAHAAPEGEARNQLRPPPTVPLSFPVGPSMDEVLARMPAFQPPVRKEWDGGIRAPRQAPTDGGITLLPGKRGVRNTDIARDGTVPAGKLFRFDTEDTMDTCIGCMLHPADDLVAAVIGLHRRLRDMCLAFAAAPAAAPFSLKGTND